jgi:hypothetical protein
VKKKGRIRGKIRRKKYMEKDGRKKAKERGNNKEKGTVRTKKKKKAIIMTRLLADSLGSKI